MFDWGRSMRGYGTSVFNYGDRKSVGLLVLEGQRPLDALWSQDVDAGRALPGFVGHYGWVYRGECGS